MRLFFLNQIAVIVICLLSSCTAANRDLQYTVITPEHPSDQPPMILLLHGMGSNENDLLTLISSLPPEYLIVSARAPMAMDPDRYQWFRIQFNENDIECNFQDAENSRKKLQRLLEHLIQKYNPKRDQIYLLGFSQGAIMSYNIALTHPELVGGVIACGGKLMNSIKPLIQPSENIQHLKMLLIHGTNDSVVPAIHAQRAYEFLISQDINPTLLTFDAQHEISNEMLVAIGTWLQESLQ